MVVWLVIVVGGTTVARVAASTPIHHQSVRRNTVANIRQSQSPSQPLQQQQQLHQQRRALQSTEDDDQLSFGAASDTGGSASTRVVIEPFQLKLSKYSSMLTESELYDLRDTMEIVALRSLQNFTSNSSSSSSNNNNSTTPMMGNIELIKFGGAKQVYNFEYQVILVKFDFGVAQYDSLPIPDAVTINEWIGNAFTTKLLFNLKAMHPNSTFASLEHITYGLQFPQNPNSLFPNYTSSSNSSTGSNNGVDVPGNNDEGNGNSNQNGMSSSSSSSSSKSSSRSNIPLIAGVAAGAAVGMMLLIMGLVAKQRRDSNRRTSVREVTNTTLDFNNHPSSSSKKKSPRGNGTNSAETSPSSSKSGGNSKNNKLDTADLRSLADSESEWTVATEAGDTMALKNIAASLNPTNGNGSNATNKSASLNDRHISLMLSESFERDRTVAITKDMLTGQWSGRVSNQRGGASQHHQQSESVLQPSHFSASHERRVRKAQRAAAAAAAAAAAGTAGGNVNAVSMPDRETSSVSSKGDESSVDDSLVFEQAHEDTTQSTWFQPKEQVSPSNTSKRRTRDAVPPLSPSSDTRQIA
jgi:hypothetical protein